MNPYTFTTAPVLLAIVVTLFVAKVSTPVGIMQWQRSRACAYWSVSYAWFSSLPYINRYHYQGRHHASIPQSC